MYKAKNSSPYGIQGLLQEIESLWESHNLPDGIREAYRSSFPSISQLKLTNFLRKEIKSLRDGTSLILTCLNNILIREESIEEIKILVKNLSDVNIWTDSDEIKAECAEILVSYRMITLNLLENLFEWNQQMRAELNNESVAIEYSGEKYVRKVAGDLKFLHRSELARIFEFEENDPFLLRISRITENSNATSLLFDRGQCYLTINLWILKRANEMQTFLQGQLDRYTNKRENQYEFLQKKLKRQSSRGRSELKSRNLALDSVASKNTLIEFHEPRKNLISKAQPRSSSKLHEKKSDSPSSQNNFNAMNQHSKPHLDPIVPKPRLSKNQITIQRILSTDSNKSNPETPVRYQNIKYKSSLIPKAPKEFRRRLPIAPQSQPHNEVESFRKVEEMVYDAQCIEEVWSSIIDFEIGNAFLKILVDEACREAKESARILAEINIKIAEILCGKIIEELLASDWVLLCYKEALREREEYEKRKQMIKEKVSDSEINFASDEFEPKGGDFLFVGLNQQFSDACGLVDEYISRLSPVFFAYLKPAEVLFKACFLSINPCFYWLQYESIICGLVVYSTSIAHNAKHCIIQHISAFNVNIFIPMLVNLHLKLLREEFESIEFPLIPTSFQQYLKAFQSLSQKTPRENNSFVASWKFILKTSKFQEPSVDISENMMKIGSWTLLISEIKRQKQDNSLILSSSRLQEEISCLYNIASDIITHNNSDVRLRLKTAGLCLRFSYKYLRFSNILCKSTEDFHLFIVPTNDLKYSIFFIEYPKLKQELISELNTCKTDIFYKIESLFKQEMQEFYVGEFWVPCFSKYVKWEIPWVKGLQLEKNLFVESCLEEASVELDFDAQDPTLDFNEPDLINGCFWTNKSSTSKNPNFFVFGIYYLGILQKEIFEQAEIPLLVCLIDESDYKK